MLKRVLNFYVLTFYGLGTILGAGIYALIGEVGKIANQYTPVAFLVAAVIATFTAISYSELCSRYPYTAGSALYIQKAFHKKWLSGVMGWLIVLTGLVSAATLSHGFYNYFHLFVPIPFYITIFFITYVIRVYCGLGDFRIRIDDFNHDFIRSYRIIVNYFFWKGKF